MIIMLTTDVQHKIIHKRFSLKKGNFIDAFQNCLRIELPASEKLFIIPTIAFLLPISNKRCILNACSPYVEILEN